MMNRRSTNLFVIASVLLALIAVLTLTTACEPDVPVDIPVITEPIHDPMDVEDSADNTDPADSTTTEAEDSIFLSFCDKALTREASLEYALGETGEQYASIKITVDADGVYTVTPQNSGSSNLTFTVDGNNVGHISASNITVTVRDSKLVFTKDNIEDIYNG